MTHTTATAFGPNYTPFVGGCTCGWVGGNRSTLQAAIADTIVHERQAALATRQARWAAMVLPVGFKDWQQRLDEAA